MRRPPARAIDAGVVLSFVVYAVVAWWPTRNLPYFWDAAGFIIVAARDMARDGFLPFVPTHEYYAHPPLFIALVASAWRVFGDSRVVAHAVVLPFLPLAMTGAYALGVRFHGRLVGFVAATLFGATAATLCELGQVYFDLPVAALATCALAAWVLEWPLLSGFLFALAAWTKIPAATVPLGLAVLLAIDPARRHDRRAWLGVAFPIAATCAWFVYHHAIAGWWLAGASQPQWVPTGADAIAVRAVRFTRIFFFDRWRWLLFAIAIAASIVLRRRGERVFPREVLPLATCIAGGAALFIASTFMPRYALFMFPAYYVASLVLARRALRSDRWFAALGVALLALFVRTWHPRIPLTSSLEVAPNNDLSYFDMIRIGRAAAAYVETEHGGAMIYGGFHERYQLGEPWQGYVERPLDVHPCYAFIRSRTEQLLYIHGYEPEQEACHLVAEKTGARAIKRFESNGKWIEVWRVPTP